MKAKFCIDCYCCNYRHVQPERAASIKAYKKPKCSSSDVASKSVWKSPLASKHSPFSRALSLYCWKPREALSAVCFVITTNEERDTSTLALRPRPVNANEQSVKDAGNACDEEEICYGGNSRRIRRIGRNVYGRNKMVV